METTAKIIIIDDEKRICHNVKKILSKNNYDVSYATSAKAALEKMAKEAFSLLISDVVMPKMNGLELLKLVKNQWPLTKVIMITAYGATDTALKSMRLGALDYIPKPFTPDQLRSAVEQALGDKLVEASVSKREKEAIDTTVEGSADQRERKKEAIDIIDVDMPFDRDEVAKYTGEEYTKTLGPSDMPVVGMPAPETLENFCKLGGEICNEVFGKLGHICKVGNKTGECPRKTAKKKKGAVKAKAFDANKLIGIDHPFNYEEVVSITGPEYVWNLDRDGMSFIPYDELKKQVAGMMEKEPEHIPIYHEVMREPAYRDVLVIEDEVGISNNIRKILSKKGYDVDQAITKNEALQKIEETAYKVILLDLKIPEVRGLELLEAIREKGRDTAVIIITGYASIESAVETSRLGAMSYLHKPFTPDEIRDATDNAFRLAA